MGLAFAGRHNVIVATDATTNNLCMIHGAISNGLPGRRCRLMTGGTIIRGTYMIFTFASGHDIVMATDAGPNDLTMINGVYGYPVCCRVTCAALISCIDMVCTFACSVCSVMTAQARLIYYLRMIEDRDSPGIDVMTLITCQLGRNMR